jgi:hypothetical protein
MSATPISPKLFKRVLEKCGYEMIDGDNVCWLMESNGQILVIPQTMRLIPEDILEDLLVQAEITEERLTQILAQIAADDAAGGGIGAFAN